MEFGLTLSTLDLAVKAINGTLWDYHGLISNLTGESRLAICPAVGCLLHVNYAPTRTQWIETALPSTSRSIFKQKITTIFIYNTFHFFNL